MHARRRRRIPWGPIVVALLAITLAGVAAIGLNLLGVGDRAENLARRIELLIDPPPDRPIDEAVLVTPRPAVTAAAPPRRRRPRRASRARRRHRTRRRRRSRHGSPWTWTSSRPRRSASSAKSTRTGARSPGTQMVLAATRRAPLTEGIPGGVGVADR